MTREEIRRLKRQKRRRQVMIYRCIFAAICLALILAIVFGVIRLLHADKSEADGSSNEVNEQVEEAIVVKGLDGEVTDQVNDMSEDFQVEPDNSESIEDTIEETEAGEEDSLPGEYTAPRGDIRFFESESTSYMGSEEVTSTYSILVNVDNQSIVSSKNGKDRISPASMTKILTLLVACERITDLDDKVTVTIEATDYAYSNDLSSVGFAKDEVVRVEDLLYGTILPSGGDAAYALACYVAGSHEAFVDMMNQELSVLGISDTAHFTNCAGLYNENHYCSAYDMAVILEAAMENPLARKVLSAHKYTTTSTIEHPDGIDISNLFLRRIEDKDTGGEVIGAKTGFVVQSGNCAASYYTCRDGQNYICVTADAHSAWRAIYDHVAVYNIYAAGNTDYKK